MYIGLVRAAISAVIAGVLLVGAAAQNPATIARSPDYSGTWNLNYEESDWGNFPSKERFGEERVIRQNGNSFTLTVIELDGSGRQTQRSERSFTVPSKGLSVYNDKTLSEFLWMEGKDNDPKSLPKKGQYALVWDIRSKENGGAVLNEIWSLSPDKRKLTIGLAIMGGVFKRWYVFDRQD